MIKGISGTMQNRLTRKLVLSGLFAALICVVTWSIRIPVPLAWNGAYINAGDSIIYVAGVILGGPWAALSAGIGSAIADLLCGAASYAPGTLVIKALMGLVVGFAAHQKPHWSRYLVFMVLSSLVMVVGYTLYEFFVFAGMNVAVVSASILPNLLQAGGGVLIGLPLAIIVRRVVPESWQETLAR